jgi:hypothetical protein
MPNGFVWLEVMPLRLRGLGLLGTPETPPFSVGPPGRRPHFFEPCRTVGTCCWPSIRAQRAVARGYKVHAGDAAGRHQVTDRAPDNVVMIVIGFASWQRLGDSPAGDGDWVDVARALDRRRLRPTTWASPRLPTATCLHIAPHKP